MPLIRSGCFTTCPIRSVDLKRSSRKVKSDGWFQVWVYGREGNGWIIYFINPIRAVTSRLPLGDSECLVLVRRPAAALVCENTLQDSLAGSSPAVLAVHPLALVVRLAQGACDRSRSCLDARFALLEPL